ncbi:hypothetical protein [Flavobacterium sp. 5]|uniref:hypothetical protein n=1 Tax=Flavobacterium sp. 5 TaxID=2035199 RepID=UPI000C2C49A9|nr:hypothetical protein [Flavobacterium sp. 5]PKB17071.1 hypothetical protein CLU82_2239 [Flavobacterium sp. 5]
MNKKTLYIIMILSFFACKPQLINQKIDKKKEGKWVITNIQDSIEYKSFEFYKNDEPIKKWKSYINGKKYKIEKYKNGICLVKVYHENGKIESKGNTKLENNDKYAHWFYFGDWKYYDQNGKLISIKKYENGEFISETKIKN